MIQNRKKYIAIIIAIGLLLTLIVAQKVYAQYILTREFTIEMTTTPFNLEVSSKQIDIYNWGLDKGKVSTTVVNNNTYDIEGNISINGNILKSFTLAPGASQEMTDLNLTDDTMYTINFIISSIIFSAKNSFYFWSLINRNTNSNKSGAHSHFIF